MYTTAMVSILVVRGDMAGTMAVLAGAAIFAATMLVILALISRSVRQLREGAERFAGGDLSQRIDVRGPLQLAQLAESLNTMARQLADRLTTVSRHRNELSAVHGSMVEGVLAIDHDQHILSLNPAASEMLSLDPVATVGRKIYEVVRNADLHDVIRHSLERDTSVAGEMTLDLSDESEEQSGMLIIRLQSAILRDEDDSHIGLVLVLHDVTQLRRLESVRRDFVSNVSHEVKTPVSAIKAAVETVRDLPSQNDPDAQRFLRVISRQADRLAAIVDDLLSLARIEQDLEHDLSKFKPNSLWLVIQAAIETCEAAAEAKNIQITSECDKGLIATFNEQLLTQAMINLIDNAVKYSDPDTSVWVTCEASDQEVVLIVTDQGRGIEAKHLPRIFERFYRTDKARSRELGGTGLGLSIVKHVAEAHGGHVSVESTSGSGSTFRFHLPAH